MKVTTPPSPPLDRPTATAREMTPQRDHDPELMRGAKALEAVFLDTMFQAMRKSVPKSEYSLENSATKIYRSMADSEIAQRVASNQGLGLAELIVEQAERNRYNHRSGAPENPAMESRGLAPSEDTAGAGGTGGTDESF